MNFPDIDDHTAIKFDSGPATVSNLTFDSAVASVDTLPNNSNTNTNRKKGGCPAGTTDKYKRIVEENISKAKDDIVLNLSGLLRTMNLEISLRRVYSIAW